MSKATPRSDRANEPPLLRWMSSAANERAASEQPGGMDLDSGLRDALKSALKACPLSRQEVAEELGRLVGRSVGAASLDAWLADSKEGHRFPAAYVPAFCRVVGSIEPLRVLASACGSWLGTQEERLLVEFAQAERTAESARRRKRELAVLLGDAS